MGRGRAVDDDGYLILDDELPGNDVYVPEQLDLFSELRQEPLEVRVLGVQEQAYELWKDRQRKYGCTNISRTGALGCYVRGMDKLARLGHVYRDGAKDMPDESISDSWLDLMNYAMMGYMCHNGLWPKE